MRKVIFMVGLMLMPGTSKSQNDIQKLYIGIELNNVLCGYSEVLLKENTEHNTSCLQIDQKTYISFKALGKDVSQKQVFSYKINPETDIFIYHDSYIEQGEHKLSATMMVDGDSITVTWSTEEESQNICLADDVILPNTIFYPYLKEDFGLDNLESKTYTMFDVRSGKIRKVGYTNAGREKINLNNKDYEAVIASESDHPELVSLSLKITEGSSDSWMATRRLSTWVADNIDGSVYGGSAYETFKRGNGACGSQSLLLAALCRAAGIPARVVWGCLYTPEYGGSFGHHG